ncbi:MAG: hypothetical protein OXD29_15795 [Roseovarius sp.]|nr:hypothetical protein [Roseovarius sp.]MCY4209395.1 hypothetical protein [Roseovarius sp.]
MIEIGACEAKARPSSLPGKVSPEEEAIIIKRGKVIAHLVPAKHLRQPRINATIDKLPSLRKEFKLNGLDWKDLRNEHLR